MAMRIADVQALAGGIEELALWLRRAIPSDLSISTMAALSRLQREGPLRVSDLAVSEAMTQPGVTLLVNRLAEHGLAERVPDPTDRRAALVRITERGRALLADRHAARARLLRERIAALDPDDQDRLAAALPAIERLVAPADPTTTPKSDTPKQGRP
jgi:DNA-binding MarR family transcriptional regulator